MAGQASRRSYRQLRGCIAASTSPSLEEVGQHAFEKYLATQIYPESRALVEAHRDQGHTIAIITSATRYQAEPVARELGIKHLMYTKLGVEDGKLTGDVVRPTCYGKGKATAAEGLALEEGLELEQSYFYSDSHEDLPLFDVVGATSSRSTRRDSSPKSPRSGSGRSVGLPVEEGRALGTSLALG